MARRMMPGFGAPLADDGCIECGAPMVAETFVGPTAWSPGAWVKSLYCYAHLHMSTRHNKKGTQ